MRMLPVALFALWIAQECGAQSSVQNGDFHTDLSRWAVHADLPNVVSWTPVDRDGSAQSGSALFLADAPCVPTGPNERSCPAPALSQCVSIRPSRSYRASISGLVPSGPDQHGFIQLAVTPYSQDHCTGSVLLFRTVAVAAIGAWQDTSFGFSAPLGSRSALVEVAVFRDTSRSETFRAYVDQIGLEDTSHVSPSIPLSPLAHLAFAALLASAGLLRLARAP